MLNKDKIVKLLETNDRAVARALLVVNSNQTASEQASEATINRNGMGFRPCHARMGTSMATFFEKRGYLTEKQVAYWRKLDRAGNMRIAIYWRQLAEAAAAKETKQESAAVVEEVDLGNAMEELMVLEERRDQLAAELKEVKEAGEMKSLTEQLGRVLARITQIGDEVKAAKGVK